MPTDPTLDPSSHPAKPEQPREGFDEGESNREAFPEDQRVGRFSDGEELLPDTPEKEQRGRFSEGQEELGEEDPEKHVERRFSEGQDLEPPEVTP
jgi:hypothetical protein